MDFLSRTEEIILLAVYRLENHAYGVTIRSEIQSATGIDLSVGAVYVPLERLTKRGLLKVHVGTPTPERGGRSKRYYRITPKGLAALGEVQRLNLTLWANVPDPLPALDSAGISQAQN